MSIALLFVLGLFATGAVIALATVALRDTAAPPSAPRSTVRQASIVCPEVGNLTRVWMDVLRTLHRPSSGATGSDITK